MDGVPLVPFSLCLVSTCITLNPFCFVIIYNWCVGTENHLLQVRNFKSYKVARKEEKAKPISKKVENFALQILNKIYALKK